LRLHIIDEQLIEADMGQQWSFTAYLGSSAVQSRSGANPSSTGAHSKCGYATIIRNHAPAFHPSNTFRISPLATPSTLLVANDDVQSQKVVLSVFDMCVEGLLCFVTHPYAFMNASLN
jgi:hypothetical protein